MKRLTSSLLALAALSACEVGSRDGPLDVALIAEPGVLFSRNPPYATGARHLHAATSEGLVGLDSAGQIVPAIAQRWIVTDDAMSYIFRLRDSSWADREPIRAEEVELALKERLGALEGTALGLDLAKITEVRAMTGQIVEIRLSSPMPEFLRLLAQPELGLVRRGSGVGPMIASLDEATGLARLSALSPTERGLSDPGESEEDLSRSLTLLPLPAMAAVDAFQNGTVDLVLGGTIADFPLAELGPLSRGTIQVDPALGLLGLSIRRGTGFLSEASRREALSMAIDRDALIAPFGLGGWQPTTWIVPQASFSPLQYPASRWTGTTIEQRRAEARRRVAEWEGRNGEDAQVSVSLPQGPGSDLLFEQLADAWQAIGVDAVRARTADDADLYLRDLAARYSSPRWFLNRFNCSINRGLCSPEADELVRQSLTQLNAEEKQALLADAHMEMVSQEIFIPLGSPVRWSLVRGTVSGFTPNQWALHPLFPLSAPPT